MLVDTTILTRLFSCYKAFFVLIDGRPADGSVTNELMQQTTLSSLVAQYKHECAMM